MSDIRTIPENASLDQIWEEGVFTEARMLKDSNAEDFAPRFGEMVERTETVRAGQYQAWRKEIVAQAGVSAMDDRIDDVVEEVVEQIYTVSGKDRSSPRFRRYSDGPPSAILRLGLESEIKRVEGWPTSLAGEPEPATKALAPKMEQTIAEGRQALSDRVKSASERADHRVREIVRLIDDLNALRLSVYGALVQRAVDRGLPRDWPNRFFRRARRAPRRAPVPTPAT